MNNEEYHEKCLSPDEVKFYTLHRKFVDENYDVPEEAREVLYYSLAIGHHLGIVDCLKVSLQCSRNEYQQWLSHLPKESEAYRKMAGFFTFGEITVFPEHTQMLAAAFDGVPASQLSFREQELTAEFIRILAAIHREPTMYLMVRDH